METTTENDKIALHFSDNDAWNSSLTDAFNFWFFTGRKKESPEVIKWTKISMKILMIWFFLYFTV